MQCCERTTPFRWTGGEGYAKAGVSPCTKNHEPGGVFGAEGSARPVGLSALSISI